MKKILLVVIFLMMSALLFALPSWNPWCRTWAFYFNDEVHYLYFDRSGKVEDQDSGKVYKYDWDMEDLYIFNYKGHNYEFKIKLYNNDLKFNGKEVNLGFTIHGNTSN